VLEGITVGTLPEAVARRAELAGRITEPDVGDREELALVVLANGTLLALEAAGWAIVADLAEPIGARKGETTLYVHGAINRMIEGDLSADEWRQDAQSLGIADLPLLAADREPSRA
jgi:hypothetical protein